MHDFRKTRIIRRGIAKYNANILIHLQNMKVMGQFPCSRAKTRRINF